MVNNAQVSNQNIRRVKATLDKSSNKLKNLVPVTQTRIDKAIGILSNKANMMASKSRKRSVFEAWRNITIGKKSFNLLVAKALTKSLYSIGFEKIKA